MYFPSSANQQLHNHDKTKLNTQDAWQLEESVKGELTAGGHASRSVAPSPIITTVLKPYFSLRRLMTFPLPPLSQVGWLSSNPAYSPVGEAQVTCRWVRSEMQGHVALWRVCTCTKCLIRMNHLAMCVLVSFPKIVVKEVTVLPLVL